MIENSHVEKLLLKPEILFQELPLSSLLLKKVAQARHDINKIIQNQDQRLLVIVGPCSIHDTEAALEYASLLKKASDYFKNELYLVMRVYFEKPRTTVGWKGLISDPFLNGTFDINEGLRSARKLLLDLAELDIPTATEFLDTIIPQYLSELIAWSAIGARTSSSQMHRELASGLPMPVGFKNSIDGNIKTAIDAVKVASLPHHFLTINVKGSPVITQTKGNHSCHIILRGSDQGPNYGTHDIEQAIELLQEAALFPSLMIDCSHGNSMKNYEYQHQVVESLAEQIQKKVPIFGVMMESNLVAGKQVLDVQKPLIYGQSVTDGCISWEETLRLLEKLAQAKKMN